MPMTLEMVKSAIATIILLLAIAQALEMTQVLGYVRLVPVEKRTLRRMHRRGGIAALILMSVVAAICVLEEGIYFRPLRVGIHAIAGPLAMVVLLTKIVISHRARRLLRFSKILGGLAGALILITFVASVVGYYL